MNRIGRVAPAARISLIVAALLTIAPIATAQASSPRPTVERVAAVETTLYSVAATPTATTTATVLLAAAQVGIKDQSFSGASTAPSGSKPESKLWFNDGIWWADMWDTTTSQFHIFRLSASGLTWQDTGTVVDTRGSTRGDALWDGAHLYIASHDVASDSSHNTTNRPARLYRFSYDSGAKTYTKDAGFPVIITTVAVETLVIDKDSTGTLWATWTQAKKLVIAHTQGSDLVWGTPFTPVITGISLNSDDISSLIAYGGNRIGVMWSNQSASHMYFTSHRDGDPDTTWTASEAATNGGGSADDHINLKTDSAGRIYAAVKTSFTSSSAVLIHLLVRAAGGGWSDVKFGTVVESHTRPIVLIDEASGVVHMYASGPYPGSSSGQSGGTIYEKTAPIGAISFASGSGTPVIQDPGSADMNNASSTKQNVGAASGIVVLATNDTKKFYWHSNEPLGGGTAPTASFTATPTSGTAPLAVAFTDTSTGNPTSWSWDFGDPGSGSANTSTLRNPSHTYNADGSYTVKLTATNGSGSNQKTQTGFVTVATAPTASFTATPTSGTAPLAVAFTDTSTGNPTSWSWDFGDPGSGSANASTLQNPSHTYNGGGTYTVTLTATNATGSDTATQTGLISVTSSEVTLTLNPTADSYVSSSNLTGNYGTQTTLKVREGDGSSTNPNYRTYLKFDVSGVSGTVSAVTLRLFVTDASVNVESLFVVGDSSWTETGITYTNAPAISGSAVGSTTAAPAGAYVSITLAPSSVTPGTSPLTLAIRSSATDSFVVSSREAAANKPELVVTYQ